MKVHTNQEILEAIKIYQNCNYVHQLTCGNNSIHQNLKGIEVKGKVILICPDCEYKQEWIPNQIFMAEEIEKEMKGLIDDVKLD